jgi:hypothetical protein
MKLFQLHYLDRSNVVVLNRAHAAKDDQGARIEAERQSFRHTIEVWEGDRKVARVKRHMPRD